MVLARQPGGIDLFPQVEQAGQMVQEIAEQSDHAAPLLLAVQWAVFDQVPQVDETVEVEKTVVALGLSAAFGAPQVDRSGKYRWDDAAPYRVIGQVVVPHIVAQLRCPEGRRRPAAAPDCQLLFDHVPQL